MTKTEQKNDKVDELEKKIKELSEKLLETNAKFALISKNFVQMTTVLKEKTLIQQSLCEQVCILSEAIAEMQKAGSNDSILKYDMPNEPYN